MRKKFITTTLMLVIVGISLAQTKTYIGIVGGGNFSEVYFNHLAFPTNIRTNPIAGVHGGVAVKFFPYKRYTKLHTGIQLQVNYSQKGYSQIFNTGAPSYNVRMNYLTIPVSAIVYFGNKNLKFFFSPGIYGEFLQNVDTNYTPEDDDTTTPDVLNVGVSNVYVFDKQNDYDNGFGVLFEVGFFRDFPFGQIQISGEASYSITNILNFGERSSGIPDASNHVVFGFRVGYFFGLGKLEL